MARRLLDSHWRPVPRATGRRRPRSSHRRPSLSSWDPSSSPGSTPGSRSIPRETPALEPGCDNRAGGRAPPRSPSREQGPAHGVSVECERDSHPVFPRTTGRPRPEGAETGRSGAMASRPCSTRTSRSRSFRRPFYWIARSFDNSRIAIQTRMHPLSSRTIVHSRLEGASAQPITDRPGEQDGTSIGVTSAADALAEDDFYSLVRLLRSARGSST